MRTRALAAAIVIASVLGGCRGQSAPAPAPVPASPAAPAPAIKPVPVPDISRNPPVVQQQLRDQFAILAQKQSAPGTSTADLAEAYGRTGMLLMAAEYFVEAEIALTDAEILAPNEMRWPYYLGHIYKTRGDTTKSAAAFERAVKANGSYAPALVYLGNADLDQGKPDAAAALYRNALSQQPRLVAALVGLGRAALAQRDYTTAITNFEQALSIDPQATGVHYPLGLAYRGAGQLDRAQAHLAAGVSAPEIKPPDPVRDDVDTVLESAVSYEVRGARALDAGDWKTAVDLFRRGVAIAPDEPNLRHKLGTALAMLGDQQAAYDAFQETTRRSPSFVKAHYSLALIDEASGEMARAQAEFSTALKYQPNYVEARLQLAELLRHTGRAAAAVPEYEKVLELDPRLAEARYGDAMALVQVRRYRDARDRLADGVRQHPDHPAFAVALGRLLASAPDDGVRDGAEALRLLQSVPPDTQRTFDWGIAMAMALAETGRYDDAVIWQRQAVRFATGDPILTRRLTDLLHLYEQKRPCRTPWSEGEPMELVDRPTA